MAHVGSTETERKYSVSMQDGEPISFLYGPPGTHLQPAPLGSQQCPRPGSSPVGKETLPLEPPKLSRISRDRVGAGPARCPPVPPIREFLLEGHRPSNDEESAESRAQARRAWGQRLG